MSSTKFHRLESFIENQFEKSQLFSDYSWKKSVEPLFLKCLKIKPFIDIDWRFKVWKMAA